MSANRRKITAFLVLANYVLALTVGASFHVHGVLRCAADGARSSSRSAHRAAAASGDCASHHPGRCFVEGTAAAGAPLVSSGSEKCPVCQFLAQKPVPARAVRPADCSEVVEAWRPAGPIRPAENGPSTHFIRGPPLFA